MQLIDIGANLTHESFDYDRDAVLQRAYEAGVVQMVVTGSNRTHSSPCVAISAASSWLASMPLRGTSALCC